MTKSVLATLIARRIGEGALSLSQSGLAAEWNYTENDERSAITIDQLLRASSGLYFDERYGAHNGNPYMLFHEPSTAHFAAEQPLIYERDTYWYYSSGTTNLLSRVLRQSFGNDSDEAAWQQYWQYPRRALFDELGMSTAVMERDASGIFVGSSFMYATARDWARFGLLYAQDGIWQNRRLLPDWWLSYATKPTKNSFGQYGAQFWLNAAANQNETHSRIVCRHPRIPADAFMARGYEEQSVVVIPSRQLIVVRLGCTRPDSAWDLEEFLVRVLNCLPPTF